MAGIGPAGKRRRSPQQQGLPSPGGPVARERAGVARPDTTAPRDPCVDDVDQLPHEGAGNARRGAGRGLPPKRAGWMPRDSCRTATPLGWSAPGSGAKGGWNFRGRDTSVLTGPHPRHTPGQSLAHACAHLHEMHWPGAPAPTLGGMGGCEGAPGTTSRHGTAHRIRLLNGDYVGRTRVTQCAGAELAGERRKVSEHSTIQPSTAHQHHHALQPLPHQQHQHGPRSPHCAPLARPARSGAPSPASSRKNRLTL